VVVLGTTLVHGFHHGQLPAGRAPVHRPAQPPDRAALGIRRGADLRPAELHGRGLPLVADLGRPASRRLGRDRVRGLLLDRRDGARLRPATDHVLTRLPAQLDAVRLPLGARRQPPGPGAGGGLHRCLHRRPPHHHPVRLRLLHRPGAGGGRDRCPPDAAGRRTARQFQHSRPGDGLAGDRPATAAGAAAAGPGLRLRLPARLHTADRRPAVLDLLPQRPDPAGLDPARQPGQLPGEPLGRAGVLVDPLGHHGARAAVRPRPRAGVPDVAAGSVIGPADLPRDGRHHPVPEADPRRRLRHPHPGPVHLLGHHLDPAPGRRLRAERDQRQPARTAAAADRTADVRDPADHAADRPPDLHPVQHQPDPLPAVPAAGHRRQTDRRLPGQGQSLELALHHPRLRRPDGLAQRQHAGHHGGRELPLGPAAAGADQPAGRAAGGREVQRDSRNRQPGTVSRRPGALQPEVRVRQRSLLRPAAHLLRLGRPGTAGERHRGLGPGRGTSTGHRDQSPGPGLAPCRRERSSPTCC
jgi:hypothetical protein